ncbi:hypothetical protein ACHAPT_006019 [Fusarium lateritium]
MERSPELISVTESTEWNCLQTLSACVSGRLGRFARGGKPHSRPKKRANDAALIEMDLYPILRANHYMPDLTQEAFDEMDHAARNLLRSLDTMANLQLTIEGRASASLSEEPEPSGSEESYLIGLRARVDKVAMLDAGFERLHQLMSFLVSPSTLADQRRFSLGTGPHPLFTLPPGDVGDLAIDRLRRWNEILKTSSGRPQAVEDCPFISLDAKTESIGQDPLSKDRGQRVRSVVEAIFNEFRLLSCVKNATHEIRLHVSSDLYGGRPGHPHNLDMFISCCPGSTLIWQSAQCGDFPVENADNECLCDGISWAMDNRRKLHILVDSNKLFDVTKRLPAVRLPGDSFDGTSLSELLEKDVFGPIDAQAYLNKTAAIKVDSATKAQMALGLSRCLMDFFDKGLELASHTWIADNVHFKDSSAKDGKQRLLYVSLRPNLGHTPGSDMAKMFNSGNPVVLSFAKLLLEVLDGKAINIQVKPNDDENFASWSGLGDVVQNLLRDRGAEPFASKYLEVVEGCLGLWATLRNFNNRTDLSATTRFHTAGPQLPNLANGRNPAANEEFTEPTEDDASGYGRSSLFDEQPEASQVDRRTAKEYLRTLADSIEKHIKPLADCAPHERNPIKVAIIDSGVDLDDPCIRARECQIGGARNWTSDQYDECGDTCGHGTHVARLILKVAPAAKVYIAKVSKGKKPGPHVAGRISQAIEWATAVWNVDIISLSIGMDGEDETIRKALDKVLDPRRAKKVVVVAAASNWGGNRHIAFPACYRDVICVHSTDGYGSHSKTNPTPRRGKDFAILGMSIKSSSKGKDKTRVEQYISGTSYATAIGAGIAANVLEVAKKDPRLWDDGKGWPCSSWGMSRVFGSMSEEREGYRYVMPWKLFAGRSEEEILHDIWGLLQAWV